MPFKPRNEQVITIPIGGVTRQAIIRDQLVPEDVYLNTVQAKLFAMKNRTTLRRQVADPKVKSFFLQNNRTLDA